MIEIKHVENLEKKLVDDIVQIHLDTFEGFFLTFMGRGFLKQMYSSYCIHEKSGLYIACEDGKLIGFLAYSEDLSGLYKFMIKKKFFAFAYYSVGAFFRKPKIFIRLIRAFLKPSESKRDEAYVELASIGVDPSIKSKGVGSELIKTLKENVDFSKFAYITLETDAVNNDLANHFYLKNGFELHRTFETNEGRKMNEYRYVKKEI